MPIDSPSIESSIEDSDSDENQTEILLNNSKNEEKMRMFLERNYSALKSIFLDGNSQNDKHNRGSLMNFCYYAVELKVIESFLIEKSEEFKIDTSKKVEMFNKTLKILNLYKENNGADIKSNV